MERILQGVERLFLGADRRLGGRLGVLVRVLLAFDQDEGPVVSRSIGYLALFSFFPLLLLLLTFASSVLASQEAQQAIIDAVGQYFPAARNLVEQNIEQVLGARSTIGIFAMVSLLWSASGVFTASYRAVNLAWGNRKSELILRERLYGLAVVLIVGLLLVATTVYSTAIGILRSWELSILGWDPLADPATAQLWDWLSGFVPTLVSVVTFILLYRTMPKNGVTWRDVWLGGLVAGLAWEAARRLFVWYLANFGRYNLIYGSVGAIIVFLLWAYFSAMILLLGAHFAAQYTFWRKEGQPVESRPLREWTEEWSKWQNQ
jgi:membrane protein